MNRWKWVRPQDVVWLLLFSALAAVSPDRSNWEILLLLCLGFFQVLEPRMKYFATPRGVVAAILLKLAICYLLIGWTGAISSTYYVVLLLPVVSAATTLNLAGTVAITGLACLAYLSFLLFLDWHRQELAPEGMSELGLRVIFLSVVAYLTHELAEANRVETRKHQKAAQELEMANRSLHAAEDAVRRSDRLAALGQLTAGLAHELRNPLGTMRASAEMLVKNVDRDNPVAKELAGFISSEVDRMNSLITRFLEFARPLRLRLQQTQMNEVIDRAIEELGQHNPPYDVTVYRNYSPDIAPLEMDAELIQRVIYNLLLNAAQATPVGGAVTVKTRAVDDLVETSVIDRGGGIASEHMENIFNPFYTTKQDGVGLGLAIVSKIVDEHGGKVAVESEPGAGALFRVFLPINGKRP
jgi:signal transduction histidine kinase